MNACQSIDLLLVCEEDSVSNLILILMSMVAAWSCLHARLDINRAMFTSRHVPMAGNMTEGVLRDSQPEGSGAVTMQSSREGRKLQWQLMRPWQPPAAAIYTLVTRIMPSTVIYFAPLVTAFRPG